MSRRLVIAGRYQRNGFALRTRDGAWTPTTPGARNLLEALAEALVDEDLDTITPTQAEAARHTLQGAGALR